MADPIQIVRSRENLKRVRGGRDGLRKYKVDFGEGFGEDGIMEDQLEYVAG